MHQRNVLLLCVVFLSFNQSIHNILLFIIARENPSRRHSIPNKMDNFFLFFTRDRSPCRAFFTFIFYYFTYLLSRGAILEKPSLFDATPILSKNFSNVTVKVSGMGEEKGQWSEGKRVERRGIQKLSLLI